MRYPFDEPGVYAIRVAGVVDRTWADRLGGLTISDPEITDECPQPMTRLVGWLPDQAALAGVLNILYNNRYALLDVAYLGPG